MTTTTWSAESEGKNNVFKGTTSKTSFKEIINEALAQLPECVYGLIFKLSLFNENMEKYGPTFTIKAKKPNGKSRKAKRKSRLPTWDAKTETTFWTATYNDIVVHGQSMGLTQRDILGEIRPHLIKLVMGGKCEHNSIFNVTFFNDKKIRFGGSFNLKAKASYESVTAKYLISSSGWIYKKNDSNDDWYDRLCVNHESVPSWNTPHKPDLKTILLETNEYKEVAKRLSKDQLELFKFLESK